MDKYEARRLRLIEIRDSMCGGKGSEIARRIGRSSSYVTRMLWGKEKKGRKRIGDDMVDVIEEAFKLPSGWLDKKQPIGYINDLDNDDINVEVFKVSDEKRKALMKMIMQLPEENIDHAKRLLDVANELATNREKKKTEGE